MPVAPLNADADGAHRIIVRHREGATALPSSSARVPAKENFILHPFRQPRLDPVLESSRRDHQTLGLMDIPPRHTYNRIPKDYYLMMGDNRSSSCDSRRWGLVPRKNLIGKVFATYWPPSRISIRCSRSPARTSATSRLPGGANGPGGWWILAEPELHGAER